MVDLVGRETGAVPQYLREGRVVESTALSRENKIIEMAIARMDPNAPLADKKLQGQMAVVLRHLHAIVDELELQEHELLSVFDFIKKIAKNNDVMMMADLLGISMRVNDLTYRTPRGTAPNVVGPLYREEAPFMSNPGAMVENSEPGEHIWMQGTVHSADDGKPLAGATLDFWQTNSAGKYENEDPAQPDYNFRRRIRTDENGAYRFSTVIPGAYSIANRDSLAHDWVQRLGRGVRRAPHLHVIIAQPGFRSLTTLIYFEGSPENSDDCIFSCRRENMARIDAAPALGELKQCTYDVALTPDAVRGGR